VARYCLSTEPKRAARKDGKQAQTIAERQRQVHDLLQRGTLLECFRRLHIDAEHTGHCDLGHRQQPGTGAAR
jgi:hypothetical protein